MNRLFNPRRLINEAIKTQRYDDTDETELIRLLYQITLNLIKNNEIIDAIYGINSIIQVATYEKEECRYNTVCVEYLERIAVDGFSYDPVVTQAVLMGYGDLLNHLGTEVGFIVANFSNKFSSSCNKINVLIGNHLNSERSLAISFQLFNRIYVSKSLSGYGFSAIEELRYILEVIELMKKLDLPEYGIVGGFIIRDSINKMIEGGKYDDVQRYLEFYIDLSPNLPSTLSELLNSIILDFPLEKKELGIRVLNRIKANHSNIDVTLIQKEDNSIKISGPAIGESLLSIKIETGNAEVIERVGWIKSVF
jgi:hypothetical protein